MTADLYRIQLYLTIWMTVRMKQEADNRMYRTCTECMGNVDLNYLRDDPDAALQAAFIAGWTNGISWLSWFVHGDEDDETPI